MPIDSTGDRAHWESDCGELLYPGFAQTQRHHNNAQSTNSIIMARINKRPHVSRRTTRTESLGTISIETHRGRVKYFSLWTSFGRRALNELCGRSDGDLRRD